MFTMTPYKRLREHDEPDDLGSNPLYGRKKLRPLTLQPARHGPLKCTLGDPCVTDSLGLSTLTPVESSDDDGDIKHGCGRLTGTGDPQPCSLDGGHSPMDVDSNPEVLPSAGMDYPRPWPTITAANSSIQASPIPHSLIDQSLVISDQHPVTPTYNQLPPAAIGQQCSDLSQPGQTLGHTPVEALPTAHWCNERLPSPVSDSENAMATYPNGASIGVRLRNNHAISPTRLLPCGALGSKGVSADGHHPSPSKLVTSKGTGAQSKKKKVAFAMGFRADCDKCRHKVPGHYSHIIRA